MSDCLAALSVWWLTGKVKHVHSGGFFFFLSLQPKCLTSLTWPRSPVSTRQSWRRQRQKKKTLYPPKRVSVPRVYSMCVKPWYPPATISLSVIAHRFQVLTKDYTLSKQSSKKKKSQIAAASAHHQYTAHPLRIHHTHARWSKLSSSFLPPQPLSKRGKAMPHLDFWAHEEKEAEMPQQKALSFDYHSISISYFVFR